MCKDVVVQYCNSIITPFAMMCSSNIFTILIISCKLKIIIYTITLLSITETKIFYWILKTSNRT